MCIRDSAIVAAGGTKEDFIHVSYGYGLFTGGFGLHAGAEAMGCTVIPVSSGNTERQVNILKDFGSDILCCTPSYALYLSLIHIYTKHDLDVWSDCVARLVMAGGATEDDIVQISFGYGLFTGALGLHFGLEKIGATVIPASSGNTQKQLMLMRDMGVTGLVATPSYALYLGECVRESEHTIDEYKLRLAFLGSEGCTPEMRTSIEKNLNVFVTDNYGLTEIGGPGASGECEYREGLHFNEDHFLPEIVDRNTFEPLGEGETGELLVTTLTKTGMPVLRYRTKDITRLNYEPCKCGRTGVRMDKVMGCLLYTSRCV